MNITKVKNLFNTLFPYKNFSFKEDFFYFLEENNDEETIIIIEKLLLVIIKNNEENRKKIYQSFIDEMKKNGINIKLNL